MVCCGPTLKVTVWNGLLCGPTLNVSNDLKNLQLNCVEWSSVWTDPKSVCGPWSALQS